MHGSAFFDPYTQVHCTELKTLAIIVKTASADAHPGCFYEYKSSGKKSQSNSRTGGISTNPTGVTKLYHRNAL
jgi:hypothetical protein